VTLKLTPVEEPDRECLIRCDELGVRLCENEIREQQKGCEQ